MLQAFTPIGQLEDRIPGPEQAGLASLVLAALPDPAAGLEIRFFELGTEVVANAAAVALPVLGGVGDVGVEVDAEAGGFVREGWIEGKVVDGGERLGGSWRGSWSGEGEGKGEGEEGKEGLELGGVHSDGCVGVAWLSKGKTKCCLKGPRDRELLADSCRLD